jgi:hypothetical protein
MTDKKKKENALIDSSAEIDLVVFYSNFPLEKKKKHLEWSKMYFNLLYLVLKLIDQKG